MSDCKVIQVIETELLLRGNGEPGDPFRRVKQYYSLDGTLLAEVDQHLIDRMRQAVASERRKVESA